MIGFDTKDGELLEVLERDVHTIPSLVQLTGISRKTIAYRLNRLFRYGLVEKKQDGGKTSAIAWAVIARRKQYKNAVCVYRGREMTSAYELLHKTPKNTILYAIEGTEMVRLADSRHSRLTKMASWQRICRKRNIIRKAVRHAGTIQIQKELPQPDFFEPKKRHHIVVHTLPHQSLMGPGCYVFTPTMQMIINEEKRYAIVVKDESVTRMIYDMVALLYEQFDYMQEAKKLNFQSFIAEVTSEQKNKQI